MYTAKPADSVSWFQQEPAVSMELIRKACKPPGRVLDVGGGASYLADRLLAAGFIPGVLDISREPLQLVQQRLGPAAAGVSFIVADVTRYVAPEPWDVWHDRAVFHFLTSPQERAAYRAAMLASTRSDGSIIVATFGPDGPKQCSGLPTMRYGPEELSAELGPAVELREHVLELHRTPSGAEQQFVYCRFARC